MYYRQQHSLKDSLWQYTHITVPKDYQPYYRLYTGGQHQRFILSGGNGSKNKYTKYCGKVEEGYYGVHLLHNPEYWPAEQKPIAPITSLDVEASKQTIDRNLNVFLTENSTNQLSSKYIEANLYYQYWATYFAKALMDSPHSVLYGGEWRITPINLKYGSQELATNYAPMIYEKSLTLRNTETDNYYPYNPDNLYEYYFTLWKQETYSKTLQFIEWSININYPLIYHNHSRQDSGRVKWWRKKVREQVCPPILVWFQPHLQAHLLLDGHDRLQAYLLEDEVPKALMLNFIQYQTFKKGEEAKKNDGHLLNSIMDNLAQNRKPMTTQNLNRLVLEAYKPNHDWYHSTLIAKPIADMDARWVEEVEQLVKGASLKMKV